MSARQQDQHIDRQLQAGDRAGRAPAAPELQALLQQSIEQAQTTPRKPKRSILAPAAVAAALLAGLTATGALPALAETVQHFAAETGLFGDGGGRNGSASGKHYSEMDDSEWIDLTAPDFVPYAEHLMPPYITLPGDVSRARFARDVARGLAGDNGTDRGAAMQVSGVRRFFEANAACLWYQSWFDAAHHGDQVAARQAGQQYKAATSWKEIVATDGGGVVASMRRVHALASRGEWTAARTELGTDCSPADIESVTK